MTYDLWIVYSIVTNLQTRDGSALHFATEATSEADALGKATLWLKEKHPELTMVNPSALCFTQDAITFLRKFGYTVTPLEPAPNATGTGPA